MLFVVLSTLIAIVSADYLPRIRDRRQNFYYVCGTYPNQYYSLYPCPNEPGSGRCSNGGQLLNVGCNYDFQCTPYASGQAAVCLGGCCCTVPSMSTFLPVTATTTATLGTQAFCYNGQQSGTRCASPAGCLSGQSCVNGLCCATTGNEWQNACAGLAALASCSNGSCGSFVCTTSNYCCECQFGRTSGLCAANTRACPTGYTCSGNGYCCPQCSNGQTPFGSCFNGQCATGYGCASGNICCPGSVG